MTRCALSLVVVLCLAGCQSATDPAPPAAVDQPQEWTSTHQAAWDIVAASPLVTLITLDAGGQPQARIVESLPPDSGRMDIWMGTNRNSAKVTEIERDPRATLFYRIADGSGYVTLRGRATIVDSPTEKERYWQPRWEAFYPDREATFVLIHFEPHEGEMVSYGAGIVGDSLTWAAPEFSF